jgi:hypothetical protein
MSLTPSFSNSDSFQPTGEDRLADRSQLSTLRDLLDLLCNMGRSTWKLDSLPPELLSLLDLPLNVFLKKKRRLACFVQEFARTRFVVKQRVSRDSFRLIFEGQFLSADLSSNFKPFAQNKPTWHITLDKEGHVSKCSKRPSSLPKFTHFQRAPRQQGRVSESWFWEKRWLAERDAICPSKIPNLNPRRFALWQSGEFPTG